MMRCKFVWCVLVAFSMAGSICYANMYNDWAQESAVNLQSEAISYAAANAIADNIRRKQNIETALKNNIATLPRPIVGLISSNEVSGYPHVDRYLTELDDKDITHYYILREDYTFQDLSGGSITIPAGFIWDGASIGKWVSQIFLDAGNTRYNSALSEGLIHDYMYRDPQRFSQEDADDLLYVNLVRCRNANPVIIYEGVRALGGDSYQGHRRRQDQGLYDVFTTDFYANNFRIYQRSQEEPSSSAKQKAKDMLSGVKKEKPLDLHSLDLDDENGDWCKCETPGCWESALGVRCICTKCGKVNVEYSRKALAMEARLKAEGKEGSWHMDRGKAVKAAQGK